MRSLLHLIQYGVALIVGLSVVQALSLLEVCRQQQTAESTLSCELNIVQKLGNSTCTLGQHNNPCRPKFTCPSIAVAIAEARVKFCTTAMVQLAAKDTYYLVKKIHFASADYPKEVVIRGESSSKLAKILLQPSTTWIRVEGKTILLENLEFIYYNSMSNVADDTVIHSRYYRTISANEKHPMAIIQGSALHLTVKNLRFKCSKELGRLIYVTRTNAHIDSITVEDCWTSMYSTQHKKKFDDGVGGVLYFIDSTATVVNSKFYRNQAILAGGVIAFINTRPMSPQNQQQFVLKNCVFEKNHVVLTQESVYLIGNATATDESEEIITYSKMWQRRRLLPLLSTSLPMFGGGAILIASYDLNGNIVIDSNRFRQNSAGIDKTLNRAFLRRNRGALAATLGGGAVAITVFEAAENLNLQILNSEFYANEIGYGRFLFVQGGGISIAFGRQSIGCHILVDKTTLANNFAKANDSAVGGGLALTHHRSDTIKNDLLRDLNFSNSIIRGNWAFGTESYGGGLGILGPSDESSTIYSGIRSGYKSKATATNTTTSVVNRLHNIQISCNGVGLIHEVPSCCYADNSAKKQFVVSSDDAWYSRLSKGYGGGVVLSNSATFVDNCSIVSNHASLEAGGIHQLQGWGDLHLTDRTTFATNSAKWGASQLSYAGRGKVKMKGVIWDMDSSDTSGGKNNSISIAVQSSSKKSPKKKNIKNDETIQFQQLSLFHSVNTQIEGGSVVCRKGETLTFDDHTVQAFPSRCQVCPKNTYLLEGSYQHGSKLQQFKCRRCPHGADCSFGGKDIRVKPGFWAVVTNVSDTKAFKAENLGTKVSESGKPVQSDLAVVLYYCSSGFCDGTRTLGECPYNRQGILCADCLPGHSMAIGGTNCVPNGECFQWMDVLFLFIFLGFCGSFLALLYHPKYIYFKLKSSKSQLKKLSIDLGPGLWEVLALYYQFIFFITPISVPWGTLPHPFFESFISWFSVWNVFRYPGGGTCWFPNAGAATALWMAFLPLILIFFVLLVNFSWRLRLIRTADVDQLKELRYVKSKTSVDREGIEGFGIEPQDTLLLPIQQQSAESTEKAEEEFNLDVAELTNSSVYSSHESFLSSLKSHGSGTICNFIEESGHSDSESSRGFIESDAYSIQSSSEYMYYDAVTPNSSINGRSQHFPSPKEYAAQGYFADLFGPLPVPAAATFNEQLSLPSTPTANQPDVDVEVMRESAHDGTVQFYSHLSQRVLHFGYTFMVYGFLRICSCKNINGSYVLTYDTSQQCVSAPQLYFGILCLVLLGLYPAYRTFTSAMSKFRQIKELYYSRNKDLKQQKLFEARHKRMIEPTEEHPSPVSTSSRLCEIYCSRWAEFNLEIFKRRYVHWFAFLGMIRFVIVTIHVFGNGLPILRSIFIQFFCFLNFLLQILCQPFRSRWINLLQSLLTFTIVATIISVTILNLTARIDKTGAPTTEPTSAFHFHLSVIRYILWAILLLPFGYVLLIVCFRDKIFKWSKSHSKLLNPGPSKIT